MRIRNWFKKHEVLVDFLLHIPWILWGIFLGIMERIGEIIKGSLAFRLVKKFFVFWVIFFEFGLCVVAAFIFTIISLLFPPKKINHSEDLEREI